MEQAAVEYGIGGIVSVSGGRIQQTPAAGIALALSAIAVSLGNDRMLLRGLTWLILFQLIGTALNVLFLPFLPSPIIGMLLLVVFLRLRGRVSASLETASSGLLRFLPLLLTPPAAGVMMYGNEVAVDAAAILVSLTLSFILVVPLAGHLMQYLVARQARREDA